MAIAAARPRSTAELLEVRGWVPGKPRSTATQSCRWSALAVIDAGDAHPPVATKDTDEIEGHEDSK
jgi:hypothetical protein